MTQLNNKLNSDLPVCKFQVEFNLDILKGMLNAVSTDDIRYYLTGICIAKNGDDLDFVATNGMIMIVYTLKGQGYLMESADPNRPSQFIKQVTGLKKRKSDPVECTISVDDPRAMISYEGSEIASNLIDGTFPDYKRVYQEAIDNEIDPEFNSIGLNSDLIADMGKAVKLITGSKTASLKLKFSDDRSPIICTTPGEENFLGIVTPMKL
jgi:DNA polymerase-3 subunit beta